MIPIALLHWRGTSGDQHPPSQYDSFKRYNMPKILRLLSATFVLALLLAGCGESPRQAKGAKIMTMGDSHFAANLGRDKSVSQHIEKALRVPVLDRSVMGAQMDFALPISGALGMSIPKQYVAGDWEWVVLNGGGNDLWIGCGCFACTRTMAKLISPDGERGQIPSLVQKLRANRARVIYVGYLRSPGFGSPIEHCRDLGNEMERRVAEMAKRDAGVTYLSLQDLVPYGDRSFHAPDRIHPSPKGSAAMAQRIIKVIKAEEG
ncbi:SGNH/GDSL hydrolase family protein [Sulfitobacter aestuarii]|uniref:SGNH/GDSL hydrolase family protein n=1 Tax=Sulfitobacter aestuarii TaxID=2161676 RepID=A0ABW5U6V4_9RHOB